MSWQTALTVGITLLTLYGKDIIEWVGNLFKAKEQLDLGKKSAKAFNETMLEGSKNAQREVTNLNLIYRATQDVSKGMKERLAAVEKLQSQYPSYFGNMSKEDILAGKAADSYTRLASSIVASARAQAARAKIVEHQSNVLENEQNINEAYIRLNEAENKLKEVREFYRKQQEEGFGTASSKLNTENAIIQAEVRVKEIEQEIAGYRTAIYEANRLSADLERGINIENLLFDPGKRDVTGNHVKESIAQLKSYLDQLAQLRQDNEDRQVDLMQDGTEKELAEIDLRYRRIREKVQELEKELSERQGGSLTQEQSIQFGIAYAGIDRLEQRDKDKVQSSAIQEKMEKEREAMDEYLKEYGTYQEKRLAITREYERKIAEADTEGEKRTLGKQMKEALADLDIEALKTTSAISQLFGDMTDKTLKELERINEEGSAALEFLKGGQWDEQKGIRFGIDKEQFDTLSQSPEKLKAISDALDRNREAAEQLRPAYEKVADGLRDLFNAGSDSKKLTQALADIQEGLNECLQAASFLSDAFAGLGDAFGSKALSGIADGINEAMNVVNSTMQGAQAGSMFGPIGTAAGAAVGLVSSLAGAIARIHDKKNERRIQRLQDQIDVLTDSYSELGRAVEDAYSKDASGLYEDQNKLLEQKKVLIQQQIKEEEDKKKTDNDRIEQWKQQLEEIDQTIADNKEKAVDAIFGEDLQSAIENFAAAYADAWSNGEDRAQSARDTVKQMMRQMVTESIKAAIQSSDAMEEIRQKLQEFYADSVLTGWEQDYIYDMAEQLQKELDEQFGWADGLMSSDTPRQQQSSIGYEVTASQESVNALTGHLLAVYECELRIADSSKSIQNIADEVRTVIAQSYIELQRIGDNTEEIVKPIKQMQKDIEKVKENTARI